MKLFKKIFIVSFLLLLLIYVTNITGISNKFFLLDNENINIRKVWGITLEENNKVVPVSLSLEKANENLSKKNYIMKLFGKIPLKEIEVSTIPKTYVVPLGNVVGLKLYTNGVLVVGMSEIVGVDEIKHKPYENTGIEEGDMIVELDNKVITCTADLLEKLEETKNKEIKLCYVRDGEVFETLVSAVKGKDEKYKLGLWVRDAAAGVGTASFYDPQTKTFAALGHGIQDVDTGELLNIATGEFITTKIISIKKGEKGNPRENTRFNRKAIKCGKCI